MIPVAEAVTGPGAGESALDRARRKAYWRLIPLCFISYVIAYVDRSNVAIAKLTMTGTCPLRQRVIGFGAGVFFIGYFLLEIPGTLIVEKWSARKWIARIMITWGIVAALTALVKTPFQFYVVRFLLGLAEAGFYPGVIVYLTHWFASRDRARALAYFFVATPIAQVISPKLSNVLLKIGTDEVVGGVPVHHPEVWGLEGWQWIYIAWGIPAVLLGVLVLVYLTDRPHEAKWLTAEERDALLAELEREKDARPSSHKMGLGAALSHPRVLLLALIYFLVVTGSYGVEFFMPSILERWYSLKFDALTWLVILPLPWPCSGSSSSAGARPQEGTLAAHVRAQYAAPPASCWSRRARATFPHHLRIHGGLRRVQGLPARVLVAAQLVPHGDVRRGQHRVHQLRGQPGRLHGPVRARHRREADRILHGRTLLPDHVHGPVLAHRVLAGTE